MNPLGNAIVTGAGRGIGRAIAIGLAREGYTPLMISRTSAQLDAVAEEVVEATKGDIHPKCYPLDVGDHHQIATIAAEMRNRHQSIDILVNNAGVWHPGSLGATPADISNVLNVNLVAPFLLINEIVPLMIKREKGHIFNISSLAGKIAYAESGVYSTSKFGLVGLGESLYKKLSTAGIKVTTICPGWVNTKMADEADSPLLPEEMIQPEDIMETIRFLLSLSPSAHIKEVIVECRKTLCEI